MATPLERVEVQFVRDWIHAGKSYRDGDPETVARTTAEMLEKLGAIQPLKSKRRAAAADGNTTTGD